ncbi:MAG: DUF262 domain-containing protein [Phycisphaerales bacterium]
MAANEEQAQPQPLRDELPAPDLFGQEAPIDPAALLELVEERVKSTRTQSFDISVGEILSIHERGELVIRPEFQRMFRWSIEKQSRLIESLLLEVPIPPIFVIETESGIYELIDGLQRVTSIINFFSDEKPLVLRGCDIVPQLNGHTAAALPLALRLRVKRVPIRMVVVKRESSPHAKYEMFYRLNTGGEPATEQEVRNCVIRIIDNTFNQYLIERASFPAFKECISGFSDNRLKQLYDQELVLRFCAFKNDAGRFRHMIGDFLTQYMLEVTEKKIEFDYAAEQTLFESVFETLNVIDGAHTISRISEVGNPTKRATPNFFEAFSLGIVPLLNDIDLTDKDQVDRLRTASRTIKQDPTFLAHTGPGSNQPIKVTARISFVTEELQKHL